MNAKLIKSVSASILPQLVNILSNFVLPPLIIASFGSETNGLIATVKTIISYIALVGAGISIATIQALYAPVAKHDTDTVKGMLKATANLFNKCGWIFLGIVVVVSLIYPFTIKGNIPYLTTFGLVLVMSLSGASEFFVVGKCRALLYADQKVYVCSTIQAASLIGSLIIAIIMLKLHTSIVWVQFSISFVYIIRAFLINSYVNRNYPQYQFDRETKPIMAAVSKRKDAMIHQLSGLAIYGSQSVILSSMVGLEAASIYAIYNIVFSGIYSICSNMNSAITPFIGKSLVTNNIENVRSKVNFVEYIIFCLTSFVFMVSSVTILPFIDLYTKNADISYHYPTFAFLLVVAYAFNVFRLPHSAVINAAGKFRETRWRAITEASICIIASILFTYIYGLYGVAIGTGCGIGWRCLDMIVFSHRQVLKEGFILSVFRLARTFLYVGVLYLIFQEPFIEVLGYMTWILYAVLMTFISLFVLIIDAVLFERESITSLFRYIKH